MRGVFVTGTGTEVGKTVVAAALARTAAATGRRVRVFKPVESGLGELGGAPPDHELLRLAACSEQSDDEIAPYRFDAPLSPHLAAERAGVTIDVPQLRWLARTAAQGADLIVCEGVGGFLVPITPDFLVRDLIRDLGHPVVIAAGPGLGTINHTLLTVEAVRAAGLRVAGVVLTPWPKRPGELERSNRETIAALAGVEIAVLPHIDLGRPSSWPPLELASLTGPARTRRFEPREPPAVYPARRA